MLANSTMATQAPPLPELLDADSPAARRAVRIRWWFWVAILAIAPLSLMVVAVLAVVVWGLSQYGAALSEVKKEVARIQAAGEPITVEELHAYHRAPAGTPDITHLWLAALSSFNEQQLNAAAKPLAIVGEGDAHSLPASDLPAVEQFLTDNDPTVQATLAAAQAEGESRFPVEFEKGFSALLPNAQKMRALARLMKLRGRVAVARGRTDQAVQSVEAVFATSRAMEHQLLLIEHLVRLALANMALRETEFLLNEVELTDEQLVRLQAEVQALDLQQGLTEGLLGERALGYHAFHHLEQMNGGEVGAPPNPGEGSLSRPTDCRLHLGFMQELITASRQPFPEALEAADVSQTRLMQLAGERNPIKRYNAMMTLLIMPATASSFQATGRNLALRDVTLCAIAVKRHQLKHGQWPQSIAQLVPEFLPAVPADPFDGQPLRLVATQAELVIYSVGKDLQDGGGQDPQGSGEPDVAVRLRTKAEAAP
jgi:hypothetical protein